MRFSWYLQLKNIGEIYCVNTILDLYELLDDSETSRAS